MGKCPPGVCIENMTLLFIVILIGVVLTGVFLTFNATNSTHETNAKCTVNVSENQDVLRQGCILVQHSHFRCRERRFIKSISGTFKDNRLFPGLIFFSSRMPINIPTHHLILVIDR